MKPSRAIQPFDLTGVPLEGIHLIEAGAGTGKTYTIEGLFLRLILETDSTVDRILVLTFTVAATEEIKSRIRSRLVQARELLGGSGSTDPLVHQLISPKVRRRAALRAVENALLDFDRAPIYTIHGFCQRLLVDHAFETGSLFDTELEPDPTVWVDEAASDFWRQHVYPAPQELASYLLSELKGPKTLSKLWLRLRLPGIAMLPVPDRPRLTALEPFRTRYRVLRDMWPSARERVRIALLDPALKDNAYGSRNKKGRVEGTSDRESAVAALMEALDRYLDPKGLGIPVFEQFQKATQEYIFKNTRKGASSPRHPFFEESATFWSLCQHLCQEMDRFRIWFKSQFFCSMERRLSDLKQMENIVFFDDLLLRVRDALQTDERLTRSVRGRYRAALVDEFQDTDPVQYEIFRHLFGIQNNVLFMIGDPKQAIYGFRGADVFSYLDAASHAENRHTLNINWRSSPELIEAINALFSNSENPFIFNEIQFTPGRPPVWAERQAVGQDPPFKIWLLGDLARPALAKSRATEEAICQVRGEISRLLSLGKPAGDIAVLVRTNRQAGLMKASLSEKEIPAVQYRSGSVFETDEAMELQRLLTGVLKPSDIRKVRAAMGTAIMGTRGEELSASASDAAWIARRGSVFEHYHELWSTQGFLRMFREMMDRENIRGRLLCLPEGERKTTNLLHLAELCHRVSTEKGLGPAALLQWIQERRVSSRAAAEEELLRLESDAHAVQIVTIHRSKGSEFPIVFVPFAWESAALKMPEDIIFHDPDARGRLTLDLGGGAREQNEVLARTEALAEEVRLLYVALTRAKERCYLAWGHIRGAEYSALAYLLYGRMVQNQKDVFEAIGRSVAGLTEGGWQEGISRLLCRASGAIEVAQVPASEVESKGPATADEGPLSARRFTGKIERDWRVSSYSRLISGSSGPLLEGPLFDGDGADRDQGLLEGVDRPSAPDPAPESEAGFRNIADFPGGSRAGTLFHDIFEHVPFSEDRSMEIEPLVERKLLQHGFDTDWRAAVSETVRQVLSAPLMEARPDLRLSCIPAHRRIHEMDFVFPLQRISPHRLADILKDVPGRSYPDSKRLLFAPVQGMLKGFIDLIFFHSGLYYLVDWKSNRLGPQPDDYDPPSLRRVMERENYILQYTLYSLALDLYLSRRDPNYRYETGFGGIFYVFLRGVLSERGPGWGIYYDRIEPPLVSELRRQLVANSG